MKILERVVIKSTPMILVLVIIINSSIFIPNYNIVYSQNLENNNNINGSSNNVYSWISKSDDLNITMQFEPKIPIINQQTKILFQINHLNGSEYIKNVTAIVTIIDSEGGLYKFGKQELHNGNILINYIFPNNVKNKIIVQLYKNNQGFALASYDFQIPTSSPSASNILSNFFSDLFKNILDLFKNILNNKW